MSIIHISCLKTEFFWENEKINNCNRELNLCFERRWTDKLKSIASKTCKLRCNALFVFSGFCSRRKQDKHFISELCQPLVGWFASFRKCTFPSLAGNQTEGRGLWLSAAKLLVNPAPQHPTLHHAHKQNQWCGISSECRVPAARGGTLMKVVCTWSFLPPCSPDVTGKHRRNK